MTAPRMPTWALSLAVLLVMLASAAAASSERSAAASLGLALALSSLTFMRGRGSGSFTTLASASPRPGARTGIALVALIGLMVADWRGQMLLRPGPIRLLVVAALAGSVLSRVFHDAQTRPVSIAGRLGPLVLAGMLVGGVLASTLYGATYLSGLGTLVALAVVLAPIETQPRCLSPRLVSGLCWLLAAYTIVHALYAMLGLNEGVYLKAHGQEQAPLLVLAIFACWQWRRRLLLLVVPSVALALASYFAYSYFLAGGAAAAILLAAQIGVLPSRSRRLARSLVVLCTGLVVLFAAGSVDRVMSDVFGEDNSITRRELLEKGFDRFEASPLIGTAFTEPSTVRVFLDGQWRLVPVHNDYLGTAVGGGVIAFFALVGWIAWTNVVAMRSLEGIERRQRQEVMLGLVFFDVFWVCAGVNPLFEKPGYSLLVALSWRLAVSRAQPGSQRERASRAPRIGTQER